jgi:hypothetical protein
MLLALFTLKLSPMKTTVLTIVYVVAALILIFGLLNFYVLE